MAMDPNSQNVIYALFGFVGLLIIVVIGTIAMSQRKRRELPPSSNVRQQTEAVNVKPLAQAETPSAKLQAVPAPVEEKDVDLSQALKATEQNFFGRIRTLFEAKGENTALEDIEEVLYTSDLGPKTVQELLSALEEGLSKKELRDPESVRQALRKQIEIIFARLGPQSAENVPLAKAASGPTVILVVGMNGAGKTTSIGKIAAKYASENKKVLVAAGDTFRAAAGAQLKVWTDRAQVEIFSPKGVTDPAAVAFDAFSKAKARGDDIVIVDTAGRLHTQGNLMEELKKVRRVIQKVDASAPHETLIVLDANSGQNALMQAKEFNKVVPLTGAILTKMDGTAKGGVAVGLVDEVGIPVKLIGVGERVRDLRNFSVKEYIDSILGI